ncbi:WhiB family transcriptional regulator [Streptomyces sp. NPDC056387]|uniref:WhiB family transcriptional regulator n=1 Tax=Streptomyces sp. NPDC056387 TaxID=3345803 RepID=UPI0035D8066B
MTNTDWMDQALCAQTDPEIFFSDSGHYRDARKICDTCPVRPACLKHAQNIEADRDPTRRYGLWAGTTPRSRSQAGKRAEISGRRQTIIRLDAAGHSVRAIAAEVDITERAVRRILSRHQNGPGEAA